MVMNVNNILTNNFKKSEQKREAPRALWQINAKKKKEENAK